MKKYISIPVSLGLLLSANISYGADYSYNINDYAGRQYASVGKVASNNLGVPSSIQKTKNDSDINKRDANQETTLMHAAVNGDVNVGKTLIGMGAKINARNISGMTALHLASANRNSDFVNLLLSNGSKVDLADSYGITPLMYAAAAGDTQSVKMMIAAGADIDAENFSGNTALMQAVNSGQAETVRVLLGNGASLIPKNASGLTVTDIAVGRGNKEILSLVAPQYLSRFGQKNAPVLQVKDDTLNFASKRDQYLDSTPDKYIKTAENIIRTWADGTEHSDFGPIEPEDVVFDDYAPASGGATVVPERNNAVRNRGNNLRQNASLSVQNTQAKKPDIKVLQKVTAQINKRAEERLTKAQQRIEEAQDEIRKIERDIASATRNKYEIEKKLLTVSEYNSQLEQKKQENNKKYSELLDDANAIKNEKQKALEEERKLLSSLENLRKEAQKREQEYRRKAKEEAEQAQKRLKQAIEEERRAQMLHAKLTDKINDAQQIKSEVERAKERMAEAKRKVEEENNKIIKAQQYAIEQIAIDKKKQEEEANNIVKRLESLKQLVAAERQKIVNIGGSGIANVSYEPGSDDYAMLQRRKAKQYADEIRRKLARVEENPISQDAVLNKEYAIDSRRAQKQQQTIESLEAQVLAAANEVRSARIQAAKMDGRIDVLDEDLGNIIPAAGEDNNVDTHAVEDEATPAIEENDDELVPDAMPEPTEEPVEQTKESSGILDKVVGFFSSDEEAGATVQMAEAVRVPISGNKQFLANAGEVPSGKYWLRIGDFDSRNKAIAHYNEVVKRYNLYNINYDFVDMDSNNVSLKVGPVSSTKDVSKLCLKFRANHLGCGTITVQ